MILGLDTYPQQLALDHVLFIRLKAYTSRKWIVFDSEHLPEMDIFEQVIFEHIWSHSDLNVCSRKLCSELQPSCKIGEIPQAVLR